MFREGGALCAAMPPLPLVLPSTCCAWCGVVCSLSLWCLNCLITTASPHHGRRCRFPCHARSAAASTHVGVFTRPQRRLRMVALEYRVTSSCALLTPHPLPTHPTPTPQVHRHMVEHGGVGKAHFEQARRSHWVLCLLVKPRKFWALRRCSSLPPPHVALRKPLVLSPAAPDWPSGRRDTHPSCLKAHRGHARPRTLLYQPPPSRNTNPHSRSPAQVLRLMAETLHELGAPPEVGAAALEVGGGARGRRGGGRGKPWQGGQGGGAARPVGRRGGQAASAPQSTHPPQTHPYGHSPPAHLTPAGHAVHRASVPLPGAGPWQPAWRRQCAWQLQRRRRPGLALGGACRRWGRAQQGAGRHWRWQ